jgi:hypothetical protein
MIFRLSLINPDTIIQGIKKRKISRSTFLASMEIIIKQKLLVFQEALCHASRNIFRRCKACLEAGNQHTDSSVK